MGTTSPEKGCSPIHRRVDGKVSRAAAAAGLDRRYLYRLLHRHGLGPEREPEG
ncbi:hypothetical protein [Sorangium sp. So ce117]|uniref:hypothetical protein n=1 Tax=Sorangium sp. So ce117 TaxID=3133277 RepID=UPI003F60FC34